MPVKKKPTKKFEKHLKNLYEHYRPDISGLPTPDELLMGVKSADADWSFEVKQQIAMAVCLELCNIWLKCGKKTSILFRSKEEHFFKFFNDIICPELEIICVQQVALQGVHLTGLDAFFEKYKNIIEQY